MRLKKRSIEEIELQRAAEMIDLFWLVGWRKIAAHLGCSVRTAQRYHKEGCMPVKRAEGMQVRALAQEITIWLMEYSKLARKK